jgi:hypothetical protein
MIRGTTNHLEFHWWKIRLIGVNCAECEWRLIASAGNSVGTERAVSLALTVDYLIAPRSSASMQFKASSLDLA